MDSNPNEKIKSILQDPESLAMIAKIAQGFLGNSSPQTQASFHPESISDSTNSAVPTSATALGQLPQSTGLPVDNSAELSGFQNQIPENDPSKQESSPASASTHPIGADVDIKSQQYNDRINLLRSLRPFMNAHKQSRVDSLITALSAAKIIDTYKGADGFGNLFKL